MTLARDDKNGIFQDHSVSTLGSVKLFSDLSDGGDSKRFGRLEYPLDLCNKVVREGLY